MDPGMILDQAGDDSTDPDAVLEETVDNETDSDDALEAAADGLDSNDALETAADGLDSDDALETAADGLDADDALEAAADGQEAHDDGLSPDDAQIEDSEETRDQENQDTEEYGPVLTGRRPDSGREWKVSRCGRHSCGKTESRRSERRGGRDGLGGGFQCLGSGDSCGRPQSE